MSNIVTFPKQDLGNTVWVCNCGCLSHFARADGQLECAACQTIASGDTGEWRKKLPSVPAEIELTPEGAVKVTSLGSSAAALRRVLATVGPAETVAVVAIRRDGNVSTWRDEIDADEQRAWLGRRLDEGKEMVLR